MNQSYRELHDKADELHFRIGDVCDDRDSPLAQNLIRQGKQIVEELEVDRKPRDIEVIIKQIQDELHSLKSQPVSVMSYSDIESLFHEYEKLREQVRRQPNY